MNSTKLHLTQSAFNTAEVQGLTLLRRLQDAWPLLAPLRSYRVMLRQRPHSLRRQLLRACLEELKTPRHFS
ncbi:MAG: hypothetical protein AB9869_10365 [Verrucomicrobiia bacterium]